MKSVLVGLLVLLSIVSGSAQDTAKYIEIKGKVKFPDERFKMMITQRNGFDKVIIDSVELKEDNTYSFKMKVTESGTYTLDCLKWQSVQFWAEDENLEIDFRGKDTAKMVIKNPPYVYIKGGRSNEVMNLLNWNNYRNYQLMIGLSQSAYKNLSKVPTEYGAMIGDVYGVLGDDSDARAKYIIENYSDRNSLVAALSFLNYSKNKELINNALAQFESINPNYAPVLKYKKNIIEAEELKEKLAIGKIAPDFKYKNKEGKEVSPRDYKGKFLIIDFWASWCGPCRSEIPNVEKIYNEFKAKGLEVLSVSIDKKRADWLKALSEEKMPWAQVNTTDSGKEIMKMYQFSGIPYIILLDKDNKIIGKNLRGEDLLKAVQEALK